MPYVLAIEPHHEQARILRDEIRARARTRLPVVESPGAAIAAIDREVPALVLVNALMPAPDEHALVDRLRKLPPSKAPQILFLPALADGQAAPAPRRSFLSFARKKGFRPANC